MDEKFNKYKNDFIKDNFFSKGSEVKEEEYTKYTDEEKSNIFINKDSYINYYKKDIFELSDEELALGIKIENLKLNKQMNNNIATIKKTMIFWLILTIFNLIGIFYIVFKIADA